MISLPYLYAVRTPDTQLKRVNALVVPLCFKDKRLSFAGVTLVRCYNLGQSRLDCSLDIGFQRVVKLSKANL